MTIDYRARAGNYSDVGFVLLLSCASVACDFRAAPPVERPTIASVAGVPLYVDDFRRQLKRINIDDDQGVLSARGQRAQAEALLNDMIDRRLLLKESEKENIVISMEEVEAAFQRASYRWSEEDFSQSLEKKDMTPAELKHELRDLLTVKKYFREHVFSRVAVTDAEIQKYLDNHPEKVLVPEQVRASQVVFKNEEEAKRVLTDVRRGTSFEDAAIKYSLSPEGQHGGDLGWFSRGVMPAIFDEVCFVLKVGDISKVVSSDYGYHLFKLTDRRAASERSADDVRDVIEGELRRKKEATAQAAKLKSLREQSEIHIREDILARLH